MNNKLYDEIENVIPVLRTAIVPQIEESVKTVKEAYFSNHYFSGYSFGCMLYDNLSNRFEENAYLWEDDIIFISEKNVLLLEACGIGFHCHKVDPDSNIPNGAGSVKSYLDSGLRPVQLRLFPINPNCEFYPSNIILAYDATPKEGLKKVFVGILEKNAWGKGYIWEKTFPVYAANDVSNEVLEYLNYRYMEEKEADPKVLLNSTSLKNEPMQPDEKEPGNILGFDEYKDKKKKKENGDKT